MQTHISCRFLQCSLLILVGSTFLFSQNQPPVSDPRAVTLASQAVAVLTQGTAISDVTLNGTATLTLGSEGQGGTATLRAKGTGEGRVDLNLSDGETRSDARNVANGTAAGAWMKNNAAPVAYAAHNCWTDAPWFFPALSSLAQTANPTFVFKYIGQEQHEGVNTQHIRCFQAPPGTTLADPAPEHSRLLPRPHNVPSSCNRVPSASRPECGGRHTCRNPIFRLSSSEWDSSTVSHPANAEWRSGARHHRDKRCFQYRRTR